MCDVWFMAWRARVDSVVRPQGLLSLVYLRRVRMRSYRGVAATVLDKLDIVPRCDQSYALFRLRGNEARAREAAFIIW